MKDIFLTNLVVALFWGGVIAVISVGIFVYNKLRSKAAARKYPVLSKELPFEDIKYGDFLLVRHPDRNTCHVCIFKGLLQSGEKRGTYLIEAEHGKPFDNDDVIFAEKEFVLSNVDKIYNKWVVKWERRS